AGSSGAPPIYTLVLNGTGVGGNGALRNIAGNNSFSGQVMLQSNSTIGANPGTQLTLTGVVENPLPAPIPPGSIIPPNLTKVGTGTVVLTADDTYTGNTYVNGGDLNIQNAYGLGVNTSAVQTVTISGVPGGSFRLSFDGYPALLTVPLVLPFTKTDMQ